MFRDDARHPRLEERQCKARRVRAVAIEGDVWESLAAVFADLKRLEGSLRAAQTEELAEMAPKRSELETVEAMIAEAEQQAGEIARELVRQSGVVRQALERDAEAVNSRHRALVARRDELQAAVSGQRITDDAIRDTMRFAADVRLGLEGADYPTKWFSRQIYRIQYLPEERR